MKTIGLLGGMSWESTVTYYKEINERVAKALGGLHSAKMEVCKILCLSDPGRGREKSLPLVL